MNQPGKAGPRLIAGLTQLRGEGDPGVLRTELHPGRRVGARTRSARPGGSAHAQQLSTLRASAAYRRDGQVQQQDGLWLDNRMGNAELTSTSGSEITPAGVTSPFGLPRSGREVTRGRHPSPVPRNRSRTCS